ncbi:hypothetical protein GP486_002607 [Trichoglossum hirsutum]|uniref:Peptidase A1 domain-containing protein n=1 Tax=Trichoglossum hirsutum TaxID=265104 RepID=A0A9P8LEG8_9PEZI|nr:hypothetical protein GP486_002607 [Trichoglossum hirsutum]
MVSGVTAFGILTEVGGPVTQRICLAPSTVVNSTLLSVETLCEISDPNMTHRECESLRGGFFDKQKSTTWKDSSLSDFNNTRQNPVWEHFNPPGITDVGYDTLRFPESSDLAFYGYGLALNTRGNVSNQGMLGLGTNSLFVERALNESRSPSRSWSLDSGSQSLANPRSGELVIGGYNRGRKDGTFVWTNISDLSGERPCPLRTKIKAMKIILTDGSEEPLMSGAETIEACIEPSLLGVLNTDDNIFRFTPSMLANLKDRTNFNPDLMRLYSTDNALNLTYTETGLLYSSANTKNWSLSMTLDSGYTTTLPHYEVQGPLRGWNAFGEKVVVPNTTMVAVLNTPTGDGEAPTLGKVFLSQSLLVVDYINNRYGLTQSLTSPGPPDLVGLGCEDQASTPPPSSTASPTSIASKSAMSTGAIAGISVGAVAGVGFAVALAMAFWRRRVVDHEKKKRQLHRVTPISEMPGYTRRRSELTSTGDSYSQTE